MTPQHSARLIPTQDEFDAWKLHPVTQFVAEAYRLKAETQRAEWMCYFEARIIPAEIGMKKLELQTREDAYRAFLETTLDDYIAVVSPDPSPRSAPFGAAKGQGRPTSPRKLRNSGWPST